MFNGFKIMREKYLRCLFRPVESSFELKAAHGHINAYSITFKKNFVNSYLSISTAYAEVAKQFNLKNTSKSDIKSFLLLMAF